MIYKAPFWNKTEVARIKNFEGQVNQAKMNDIQKRMTIREHNSIDFYNIIPNENLPKYLQKLEFKSIHIKEKQTEKKVKIFKKEKRQPDETRVRQVLRQKGNLLYLSEIFSMLSNNTEGDCPSNMNIRDEEEIRDLEEWEKANAENQCHHLQVHRPRFEEEPAKSQEQRKTQQINMVLEEMRNSKNYCHEVTQSLQTLSKLHADQKNLLSRMTLIESNAVLIKNELDHKKKTMKENLEKQTRRLEDKRKDYHQLFLSRAKLLEEEKEYLQQRQQYLEEMKTHSHSLISTKNEKKLEQFKGKKAKLEQNLETLRRQIEEIEVQASKLAEEQKSLEFAELLFYRLSLKIGIDCRENGLSWIIMELKKKGDKVTEQSLPNYLDKKGKQYLMNKTYHEQMLEQLVKEKFQFVKLIMKQTITKKRISNIKQVFIIKQRKSSLILPPKDGFQVRAASRDKQRKNQHQQETDFLYKNARSSKLINKINEIKREGQMVATYVSKGGNALEEFTFQYEKQRNAKRLYEKALGKLRKVYTKDIEHNRTENQKSLARSKNLTNYNNLLQKIKEQHIYLQDLDVQHENHILAHYKDNKESLIEQASACFGIKKAFAMFPKSLNMTSY